MRRELTSALLVVLGVAVAARAGTVGGRVTIDGEPASGTVVSLESGRQPPAAPPQHVTMDQKNLTFVPPLLAVPRGTIVDFTNSDDVQHNVFTPSRVGGKFDLGTYSRGQARSVTLSDPGEVVVLCNIHMEMEARILVLAEPTFAQTRPDGSFELSDVPAGSYRVRLWRRGWLQHTETVTVPDTGKVELDVRAAR